LRHVGVLAQRRSRLPGAGTSLALAQCGRCLPSEPELRAELYWRAVGRGAGRIDAVKPRCGGSGGKRRIATRSRTSFGGGARPGTTDGSFSGARALAGYARPRSTCCSFVTNASLDGRCAACQRWLAAGTSFQQTDACA
jgi:hypothetical protein